MLLTIDIGNTLTKFGIFEGESLKRRFDVPTNRRNIDENLFEPHFTAEIDGIIISTVVPELAADYRRFAAGRFSLEPIFVSSATNFNLKINYFPPENLGVDRLVAAFAAVEKYRKTCIVCDFGTATTIDVVTENREFLGGIIAPGMRTMSESLFTKTAQLPQITIKKPARVIGDSTIKAIESGIYFGYVGLVNGIIERMFVEIGAEPKVVATGGFAALIAESSNVFDVVDENLLLEGLRLIYEKRFK